ncbi:MAG: acyl-CoA thioesterase/bile acid-CoA:amino acid N-acyltransferase family protein [Actinomycetota bacterium]|nr:acyl-CoA thioesterase/bile acid-CoA:amino acid N-acyltransferase family protein [Actinomycetota bacterium]
MGESTSGEIEVTRRSELADEAIALRLAGLEPGRRVKVRASMSDDDGVEWVSKALFEAGDSGVVDLWEARPISGTYDKADPTGFIWSMKPVSDKKVLSAFSKHTLDPDIITITAEVDGKPAASKVIERVYSLPGVERAPLDEEGLVGTFFRQATEEPRPGIMVLGGSDGSIREDYAAVLASRGYTTLALGYFSLEGLPEELVNIPLEYFERAMKWMAERDEVQGERIGIIGKSKGAELALLLGATFEKVKAVVSIVGSGLVFQGIHKDPHNRDQQSSWTWRGQPVPFLPFGFSFSMFARIFWKKLLGKPAPTRDMYLSAMKDEESAARAAIEVQDTKGPILLISGEDDDIWPSSRLSQRVIDRLEQRGHPYDDEHLRYKGAGHGFGLPHRPTSVNQLFEPPYMILPFGGDPESNARACAEAWSRIVEFLGDNLQPD